MKIITHGELSILPEYEGLITPFAMDKGWYEGYTEKLFDEEVSYTAIEFLVEKVLKPAQLNVFVNEIQPFANKYFGEKDKVEREAIIQAIYGAEVSATIE